MRFAIMAGLVTVSLAAATPALADSTPKTGVEVGLRIADSVPLGSAYSGQSLSDDVSYRIPIWVDAGYRFNPNMYVGAFFQYGFVSVASNAFGGNCSQSGVSCSAHDLEFGAMFAYHLLPDQRFDPWAGIGVGYETLSTTTSFNGNTVGGGSGSGFQFANIQLGLDVATFPNFNFGPFASFSLGQYSSESVTDQNGNSTSVSNVQTAIHEWLTFGIRGAYDFN